MSEIPDLDPGGKVALAHLNRLYAEEYESWDELDRDDLIYWLRQVLLNYRLLSGHVKEQEDKLEAELARLHAALTIFEANWDNGGWHDPIDFWHSCWPGVDKFVPPEHQLLTWAVEYNAAHKIEEDKMTKIHNCGNNLESAQVVIKTGGRDVVVEGERCKVCSEEFITRDTAKLLIEEIWEYVKLYQPFKSWACWAEEDDISVASNDRPER